MTNLDQTLLERGCRYGNFQDVANRTNNIQAAILHNAPQLPQTTPLYREAIHMIAHKLARLVNGQINHLDSWHDIAGYALLVCNQITADQQAKQEAVNGASHEQGQRNQVKSACSDKAVIDAMEESLAAEIKAEA